jgi:hypothetical protein
MESLYFSFNHKRESFSGYNDLGWHYFLSGSEIYHSILSLQSFCWEISIILMGLSLYVTWCLCLAAFNTLSLFYMSNTLTVMWGGESPFWPWLLWSPKASCAWIIISVSRFRKYFGFFFMGLGFELRALHLQSSHFTDWTSSLVYFALVILEMRISKTICPGWPWAILLPILASQVAGSTCVRHWCPVSGIILLNTFLWLTPLLLLLGP